jgi:hypothetical protein
MEANCQTLSCVDAKVTGPERRMSRVLVVIAIAILIAVAAIYGELQLIERAPVSTPPGKSNPATDIARVLDRVFDDGASNSAVLF